MKEQVQTLTEAFEELAQEKDVLELKLLSSKPGADMLEERVTADRQSLSTRELIRRDKIRYHIRKNTTDKLSDQDCKELVQSICEQLDIDHIDNLVENLQDIARSGKS